MPKEDPRRLICRCIGVSSTRIREVALREGHRSVEKISAATQACTGCKLCQAEIEEVLADVFDLPYDPVERLENQAVCSSETLARIEGSLGGNIEPKLNESGLRVTHVQAEGLDVSIHLDHAPDPETAAMIERKLKKLVCPDLEVKIFP